MGGGNSKAPDTLEARLMADRPIVYRPLNVDGALYHSYDPNAKGTASPTKDHVKRVVDAARDLRAEELLAKGPICPSCARNDNIGKACRICGKIQASSTLSSPVKSAIGDVDHVEGSNAAIMHLILDAEALKRRHTQQHDIYDLQQKRKRNSGKESAKSKQFREAKNKALEVLNKIRAQRDEWYAEDDEAEVDRTSILKSGSRLPDLQISMKCRTGNSLTICWDGDPAGRTAVSAIRSLDSSQVLQYNLEFRPFKDSKDTKKVAATNWSRVVHQEAISEFLLSDLSPMTAYEFRCRRVGWGPWSGSFILSTSSSPPSVPLNVRTTEITSKTVMLAWNAPSKDNGNAVKSYVVKLRSASSEAKVIVSTTEKFTLIRDLQPNSVNIFEVAAANSDGVGAVAILAVRTLATGGKEQTPWELDYNLDSGVEVYRHIKTGTQSDSLPPGAILDETASFRNKRNQLYRILSRRVHDLTEDHGRSESRILKLLLRRENLLTQGFEQLSQLSVQSLIASPLRVNYENEEGVDAGGLAKDWFCAVAAEALQRHCLLLCDEESGFIELDSSSTLVYSESELKLMFECLGLYIAKAIVDKQTIGLKLNVALLCVVLGRPLDEDVISESYPAHSKGMQWVRDNDVDDVDLTFSVAVKRFDSIETVPLIPNGESVSVTEENKVDYLKALHKWLVKSRFEPMIDYFICGFSKLLPMTALQMFTLHEVQMLLSGQDSIEVGDIKKGFTSIGFQEKPVVLEWLWSALDSFNSSELSKFLVFVTGCGHLPIAGLDPPLHITAMHVDAEDSVDGVLPRAHTCFNQLVLPLYTSPAILMERLLYAVRNTGSEFTLS